MTLQLSRLALLVACVVGAAHAGILKSYKIVELPTFPLDLSDYLSPKTSSPVLLSDLLGSSKTISSPLLLDSLKHLLPPTTITVHNKYAVPVLRPYAVPIDKPVHVAVRYPVPIHVDAPYAVRVARPVPVLVDKPVPYFTQGAAKSNLLIPQFKPLLDLQPTLNTTSLAQVAGLELPGTLPKLDLPLPKLDLPLPKLDLPAVPQEAKLEAVAQPMEMAKSMAVQMKSETIAE